MTKIYNLSEKRMNEFIEKLEEAFKTNEFFDTANYILNRLKGIKEAQDKL